MKRPPYKRAGFTLVEVIVTLVVLGILAGVGVPAMTGWIDESKEKTCEANRKSLLETYAAYRAVRRISLTEADGRFDEFLDSENSLGQECTCPSGGAYALVGSAAVTCDKHSLKGSNVDVDVYVALETALELYKKNTKKNINNFDSGAPDTFKTGGDSNKTLLLSQVTGLREMLEDSGTKAWSIGPGNGGMIYLWTDQDIADLPVGTWVRAYRYNTAYNAYTVGYVKTVNSKSTNASTLGIYPVISSANAGDWVEAKVDKDGKTLTQDAATKGSFEKNTELYKKLTENLPDQPKNK